MIVGQHGSPHGFRDHDEGIKEKSQSFVDKPVQRLAQLAMMERLDTIICGG
jgi:hypothetical protein